MDRYSEVGCRPPGGIVGDSRPEACLMGSAEYRTQSPGGRLPTCSLPILLVLLDFCEIMRYAYVVSAARRQ
ncbi:MAG: hypothetical protein FWG73_03710 [Planctomycetaceae bacterium]|nr:hypothetical protein [Planctomycetaceae bacterium]